MPGSEYFVEFPFAQLFDFRCLCCMTRPITPASVDSIRLMSHHALRTSQHIRAATALAQSSSSPEVGEGMGMPEPLPRNWGGPPEFPRAQVAAPVAVMATEAALEDYRQRRRAEGVRKMSRCCSSHLLCPDGFFTQMYKDLCSIPRNYSDTDRLVQPSRNESPSWVQGCSP